MNFNALFRKVSIANDLMRLLGREYYVVTLFGYEGREYMEYAKGSDYMNFLRQMKKVFPLSFMETFLDTDITQTVESSADLEFIINDQVYYLEVKQGEGC